jgi:ADP-heptose:LPS heptosyltransferase
MSLLQRKFRSARERERTLRHFNKWSALQSELPPPCPSARKLLIIRLDDIGDYLLFRNQLRQYKNSPRWREHSITLLGNASWKDLYTAFDDGSVDDTIWVNKSEYLASATYSLQLWARLRGQGFETVIAPSRTRPLVLDDLCMLAAAPRHSVGSANTHVHSRWNVLSDSLYQKVFTPADPMIHEFHFNAQFTDWVCGSRYNGNRPWIDSIAEAPLTGSYIVCFIGANTRSKRWPVTRWIEFIQLYGRYYPGRVILAGHSDAELQMAQTIQEHTGAESIVGKVPLPQLFRWVAGAQAVVTNDTMAAHLGISANRPTLIIANGVSYIRFTEYENAGIDNAATVYPEVFNRQRKRNYGLSYNYTDAVSADIASIKAGAVFDRLESILDPNEVSQRGNAERIRATG